MTDDPSRLDHPRHADYARRVIELEQIGLTTSDAQGVADAEWMTNHTFGTE